MIAEFPSIKTMNANLLDRGISVLILGVEKEPGFHLPELTNLLLKIEALQKVKFIVFVDAELAIDNLNALVWYVTGNIDPKRDCKVFKATKQNEVNHLVVDGTRKTFQTDGFRRDWPNPVVSCTETISLVDRRWPEYGLGPMIPSPSLIYSPLRRGDGAISE